MSRSLGLVLVCGFAALVAYCSASSSLPAWALPVLPVLWLIYNFSGLDLSKPASCGVWATKAIKVGYFILLSVWLSIDSCLQSHVTQVKVLVTSAFAFLFVLQEIGLPFCTTLWSHAGNQTILAAETNGN